MVEKRNSIDLQFEWQMVRACLTLSILSYKFSYWLPYISLKLSYKNLMGDQEYIAGQLKVV